MGMELVKREADSAVAVVNPLTMEIVPLDGTIDELAAVIDGYAEFTRLAQEARKLVGEELIRRMDRAGTWTHRAGEFEITAPSPTAGTEVFDPEKVREAVKALLADDLIDPEAGLSACAIAVTLEVGADSPRDGTIKVKKRGLEALRKMGGKVREAIDACAIEKEPPPRTATVKRKGA